MRKKNTDKIYLTVETALEVAIKNCPRERYRDFLSTLTTTEYSQFRRYRKPNFELWRCEAWFIKRSIDYLNMSFDDFEKITKDSLYLEKVKLANNK